MYIYIYIILSICVFFANFADDGEHPLAEAKVYYTRLAEPIGKLWATNPINMCAKTWGGAQHTCLLAVEASAKSQRQKGELEHVRS